MDPNSNQTNQSSTVQTGYFDDMIKSKFKLFQGIRSQEEDQKMYNKLNNMCLEEITNFAVTNLDEKNLDSLESELKAATDEHGKAKVLTTYLQKIPDHQNALMAHIGSYLDKVIEASLNTK